MLSDVISATLDFRVPNPYDLVRDTCININIYRLLPISCHTSLIINSVHNILKQFGVLGRYLTFPIQIGSVQMLRHGQSASAPYSTH
jgi:hypothetical protein